MLETCRETNKIISMRVVFPKGQKTNMYLVNEKEKTKSSYKLQLDMQIR